MMKRGRKSAEEIKVVAAPFGRLAPPKALNAEQAEIWERTIRGEPDGFFKTIAVQDMLADYCRHRHMAELLGATINEFKVAWCKANDGAKKLNSLLKMRDLETRAAADKAVKLRLTNQSRYTPQAAGTAARNEATGPMPWEE